MAQSLANGLVGTGFASWYWLHSRAGSLLKDPVGNCEVTT